MPHGIFFDGHVRYSVQECDAETVFEKDLKHTDELFKVGTEERRQIVLDV